MIESTLSNRCVILSIKPQYADKIFSQTKIFEYRKSIFGSDVKKVYVYATRPISRIIGYFIVDEVLLGSPSAIWEKTSKGSGITKEFYDDYFNGHNTSYAIKIKSVKLFNTPIDPKSIIKDFRPPQNFIYYKEKDTNQFSMPLFKACRG